MAQRLDQGKTDRTNPGGIRERIAGSQFQFLPIHPGQHRGGHLGGQRRQFRQDHRAQSRDAGETRRTGPRRDEPCPRRGRPRHFPGSGAAQSEHQGGSRSSAARYGLNSGDVNTVIQAAMGGAVATTVLEGDRQFNLAVRFAPEYRDSVEQDSQHQGGLPDERRRQRLHSLERVGDHHPGYRGLVDLSRKHPTLHSDQVQRARARPGEHRGGGAGAHRQER